jgi:hypothetical protein
MSSERIAAGGAYGKIFVVKLLYKIFKSGDLVNKYRWLRKCEVTLQN